MNRSPLPKWLVASALVGLVFFAAPLVGVLVEVPWGTLSNHLGSEVVASALRLSLISSGAAVALAILFGLPLGLWLASGDFRGKSVVRGLVLLPLILPPVVGGAALLFTFGRRGLLGEPLFEATGLVVPFSIWGVILAVSFVSVPFTVVTVEGAIRGSDPRYAMVARSLGASKWKVLWRVTLPSIAPSVVAGLLLTWARAFGEFGATVAFAGSLTGVTETLPLAVFVALVNDRDAALALSLLMVFVALGVLIALRDRWLGSFR